MNNFGYLQVTRKCNQNCLFCSNPSNNLTLSYAKGKKIINNFILDGCDGVIFTGGEPTLADNLLQLINYCKEKKLNIKMITNAQKISDKFFLDKIIRAGVNHFHISIYSCRKDVQAFLTKKSDSLEHIFKSLKNLEKYKNISVNINTAINKYNAGHLSDNVAWIISNFPNINHFVWNNLDSSGLNEEINKKLTPRLNDFYLELKKAAEILRKHRKTFRVERVPLCYMPGFEYASTETRKIVKNESRNIFFLDKKRNYFKDKEWYYDKSIACNTCSLNDICAGLYMANSGAYDVKELFPVFIKKEEVVSKIINN